MKNERVVTAMELTWKQPKFGADHFKLFSGSVLVGEIYWKKWLSDQAIALYGQYKWILNRDGCLRQRVVARDYESGRQVSSFEIGWMYEGDILFASGRTYHWFRRKAFREVWAISDQEENLVFEIQFGRHWFKQEAIVTLAGSKTADDVGLLICLAFYLGYCASQDAAAAVAATAAVAAVM